MLETIAVIAVVGSLVVACLSVLVLHKSAARADRAEARMSELLRYLSDAGARRESEAMKELRGMFVLLAQQTHTVNETLLDKAMVLSDAEVALRKAALVQPRAPRPAPERNGTYVPPRTRAMSPTEVDVILDALDPRDNEGD